MLACVLTCRLPLLQALFGTMVLGAFIGAGLDAKQRSEVLRRLKAPGTGFREVLTRAEDAACDDDDDDDVALSLWLWRFSLEPLRGELDAPAGPAVALAGVMGMPFARLRAALPDEFFDDACGAGNGGLGMAAALGRKHVLSANGMAGALGRQFNLLRIRGAERRIARIARRLSVPGDSALGARVSAVSTASTAEGDESRCGGALLLAAEPEESHSRASTPDSEAALSAHRLTAPVGAGSRFAALFSQSTTPGADDSAYGGSRFAGDISDADPVAAQRQEFLGTALVLAILQVSQLVPVQQLAAQAGAARRHFAGARTPAGWSFEDTRLMALTLLSPGVLNVTHGWLARARLWRLILGQRTDGSWHPSACVAFALQARAAAEVRAIKPSRFARLQAALRALAESAFTDGGGGGGPRGGGGIAAVGDAPGGEAVDDADIAAEAWQEAGRAEQGALTAKTRRLSSMRPQGNDCPLTACEAALGETMPDALASLEEADPAVPALRVWTTMLCCAALEHMPVCYLWGDGTLYPEREMTIMDAAHAWLDREAHASPALAAALDDGKVERRAAAIVAGWNRAHDARVGELRRSVAITETRGLASAHRSGIRIMQALVTKHSTFAVRCYTDDACLR
jgi:hypothetical protein